MKQAKRNSTSGKSWLRRHRVWILLAPAWITSTALLIRVALHYGNWNLFEPLMVTALLGLPIGVLCALKLTRVSGSESSNGWHAVGRSANALIEAEITDDGECAVYLDTPAVLQ